MADIEYDIAANVSSAERAVARLEGKVEKLERQLKSNARTSRTGATQAQRDFARMRQGLASVAGGAAIVNTAYATMQQTIGRVFASNKQLSESISQLIRQLNEEELKLQIQAGLTPEELKAKIPTITQELLLTPTVDLTKALQIETQLASSGFSQKDINSGAALQTVLQLQAATNQFGQSLDDPKGAVQSISQFLKSEGVAAPSAGEVRDVGGKLTQLFAGSEIQFPDLAELAKSSSLLGQLGFTRNEKLAAFSTLVDVVPAAEASTGLKQVASRLRGASDSGTKVAALESIGLEPEDVDLVGENILQASERFKAALSQVDEKTASSAVLAVFGEKGQASAGTLFQQSDVIAERLKLLDGNSFDRNVETFRSSRFADNQRTNIQTQALQRMAGQATTWAEIRDEVKLLRARVAATGNLSTFQRVRQTVGLTLSDIQISAAEQLGFTPDDLNMTEGVESFARQIGGTDPTPIAVEVKAPQDAVDRQVELMEENNRLLEKLAGKESPSVPPPRINRNAHTE